MSPRKLLGQILKEMKVIIDIQITEALRVQKALGAKSKYKRIGEILVGQGVATPKQITKALAHQFNLRFVKMPDSIPPEVLSAIQKNVIQNNKLIPVMKKGKKLTIAASEPPNNMVLDDIRFVTGAEIECVLVDPESLEEALTKYFSSPTKEKTADSAPEAKPNKDVIIADGNDAPIVRLVTHFISEAIAKRASDIHIEPMSNELQIRYRVDGVCFRVESPPQTLQQTLLSRVKLMAGMNIAEKRRPQDGRIPFTLDGKEYDIRVSSLPASHGESVVLRILNKQETFSLEDLGLGPDDYQKFRHIIKRPTGIFLVTGPTGSGKTTTLYGAIRELNRADVKIITAEDPVEYVLPGVNQCKVRTDIGFTFASIIRAMLRQAPNIILVGEIRDLETAEVAIQAALTGHMVFSTLHTNDASSSLTRLLDMGIKPFLVSSSIQAIMAQRLIRKLCPKCKQSYEPTEEELASVGIKAEQVAGKTIYQAVGCPECSGTGYKSRTGIFEILEMNPTIREMVFRNESTIKIREQAILSGMVSLLQDGLRKIFQGITTIEEVILITKRSDISY
jgi:type IV pilus assembly protein PilB